VSPRYVPKTHDDLPDANLTLSQELDAEFQAEWDAELALDEGRANVAETVARQRIAVRDVSPYGPRSEHSFFQDSFASRKGMDPQARERLNRSRAAKAKETRAVSSSTLGGIVPVLPRWIEQAIETAVHKAAPLYAALEKIPLPTQGTTVQFVKFTAGGAAVAQSSENATVTTQDPASSTDGEPFSTVATYTDVSFQVRDRSGGMADYLLAQDLGQAYGEKVESELWVGTGSSGRIRGLTQASPTTSVATGGQSASNQLGVIWNTYQQCWNALGHAPDVLTMAPRRAAWLAQAVAGAPMDFVPDGVTLVPSPQAPTNLGPSTTEDRVFFVSRAAVPLATDGPQVSVHEQAVGNALQARFVIAGYLAFATAARPEGLAVITGMTTPTFS
jgi:hypothetical protein